MSLKVFVPFLLGLCLVMVNVSSAQPTVPFGKLVQLRMANPAGSLPRVARSVDVMSSTESSSAPSSSPSSSPSSLPSSKDGNQETQKNQEKQPATTEKSSTTEKPTTTELPLINAVIVPWHWHESSQERSHGHRRHH